MLNMLNEKVDYSRDPEAPISLGMKILKKLEKEGWRDSDVYDAIEEIIISSDVKYPKQMAMRLKRTLENYDMWEAPYKGLVNKIQKWQFVNENFASNTLNRFDHDVYYDAYVAIDNLISRNEWTIKDIDDQLDEGDIWYRDVMDEMNIDMSSLTEQEDEMVCSYIIDAMQDYLYDAMHDNVHESVDLYESIDNDNEIKYYYRPIDIKILMRQQKERQLSKYEYYVLEAALWARARSNNYHGYAPELPAVKYENGKFYASTKQDGMTEVPFNYKVMTKEWLFKN